jgi:hypothetical protein
MVELGISTLLAENWTAHGGRGLSGDTASVSEHLISGSVEQRRAALTQGRRRMPADIHPVVRLNRY